MFIQFFKTTLFHRIERISSSHSQFFTGSLNSAFLYQAISLLSNLARYFLAFIIVSFNQSYEILNIFSQSQILEKISSVCNHLILEYTGFINNGL